MGPKKWNNSRGGGIARDTTGPQRKGQEEKKSEGIQEQEKVEVILAPEEKKSKI